MAEFSPAPKVGDVVTLCGTVAMMGAPIAFPEIGHVAGLVLFWSGLAGMIGYPLWRWGFHYFGVLRRAKKALPSVSSVEWKSASEAIDSFGDPALIQARNEWSEKYQRFYIEGHDAGDKIRAIDDKYPFGMKAAPEEEIAERARQRRLLEVGAMGSDHAKGELREAWNSLRTQIENQLSNGTLIAKGFRSPHVGGNPEVNITAAEWRVLSLDITKSEAIPKDGGEPVYVGLVIGKRDA